MTSPAHFTYTPYALPLVASAAITLGLGLYAVWRRRIAGAGIFALVMLGVAEWSLAYALVLAGADLETKMFWYQVEYVGVAFIPTGWLIFALRHSRWQRWLRWRALLPLAVEPCVILAIVWTNGQHGLMWPSVVLDGPGQPSVLDLGFGPAYWINTLYSYALVLSGTSIIAVRLMRGGRLFRRQAAALAIASVAPVIGSAVYSLGLSGRLDPAPFTFTITGAALFWGFLRYGLLDVVPVARGAVFEAMRDGVLVLDGGGRIVDLNHAAARLFGLPAARCIGQPVVSLLPTVDVTERDLRTEINLPQADGDRRVDVQVSALRQPDGELAGQLVVLRDVSALRLSEERFRAQYQNLPVPTYSWQHRAGAFVLVDYNAAAAAATRGTIAGARGRRVDELYEHRPDIVADLARCMHEQGTFRREMPLELQGSERLVDVTYAFVPPDLVTVHAEDITERKRTEAMLTHQALHDGLTQLPNRHLLSDRLHTALGQPSASGAGPALLLLDLDRFKDVNDTLGHSVGDVLLMEVAHRLRSSMPHEATVARLGGDEFAVLLPGTDESAAIEIARSTLVALAAPIEIEGSQLDVGGSIGIACAPGHGADPETLLRRADVAMYVAKRAGGGHSVYSLSQDAHRPDRLALVAELRSAIENGELELHYQPKINLRTGRMVGTEGLLRWTHPQRGLIPPAEFVSLAEHTGLITSLSRWVLGAALRQQQVWRASGLVLPVAVNLSMHDLHDRSLPELVAELLNTAGLPASALEIEITESTLMADSDRARAALSRLRELGVRIAVDDFGTGYSSLAYLKELPVQELKIDRSFVRDVRVGGSDLAIIESIVDLAHKLGLKVVAEGVEDAATRSELARLGCDQAQGYYFGRPMPAAQLAASPWSAAQRRAA
jgi:diguanylate cyclase (GGDEF)-like protein/PAS domain S-box-containing protein